jgi:signal peptidase II
MKRSYIVMIILGVLILDQAVKLYVKTHFHLGESYTVIGDWFKIHFIENRGMAFGIDFGGYWGKVLLTSFRLFAVLGGTWYLIRTEISKHGNGFWICVSLIYAGAVGNLIDSAVYGMIFDKGIVMDPVFHQVTPYDGLAKFYYPGYSNFLHGNVVDMLHFPLIEGYLPNWLPFWGGHYFEFFNMIFNVADASIFMGVVVMIIWQKRILKVLDFSEVNASPPTETQNLG